jgi:hypothetical protein
MIEFLLICRVVKKLKAHWSILETTRRSARIRFQPRKTQHGVCTTRGAALTNSQSRRLDQRVHCTRKEINWIVQTIGESSCWTLHTKSSPKYYKTAWVPHGCRINGSTTSSLFLREFFKRFVARRSNNFELEREFASQLLSTSWRQI